MRCFIVKERRLSDSACFSFEKLRSTSQLVTGEYLKLKTSAALSPSIISTLEPRIISDMAQRSSYAGFFFNTLSSFSLQACATGAVDNCKSC